MKMQFFTNVKSLMSDYCALSTTSIQKVQTARTIVAQSPLNLDAAVVAKFLKGARHQSAGLPVADSAAQDHGRMFNIQGELKGQLDGMSDMSEMTSLRLQMMMDRRSKFISTLSNIMKKLSSTQDTLVQNLK